MPRYSGLPVLVGFGLRMFGMVGMRCMAADDVRSMELLLRVVIASLFSSNCWSDAELESSLA